MTNLPRTAGGCKIVAGETACDGGSEPRIDREACAKGLDLGADLGLDLRVAVFTIGGKAVDHLGDPVADLAELRLAEAAGGARGAAQPDARGDRGLFRVEGDAVLVAGDMARPRAFSVALPFTPLGRRSTSIRWVSVPPVTMSRPPFISWSANAWAFLITWAWYSLNSGRSASPKATALAAMTCIRGPPWMPGKMAELTFFAIASSSVRIMPPRGPRSVLCVVVVATWACGKGLG